VEKSGQPVISEGLTKEKIRNGEGGQPVIFERLTKKLSSREGGQPFISEWLTKKIRSREGWAASYFSGVNQRENKKW
jgi:hypothetical protein